MKNIKLTKTQFFLRFLKKNYVYMAYLKELTPNGQKILFDAITESEKHHEETNLCKYLSINMMDIFWTQMMGWGNNSTYFDNNHSHEFWHKIDNKWTFLYNQWNMANRGVLSGNMDESLM